MPGSETERVRLGARASTTLIWSYARKRVGAQLRAVWLIVAYLVVFQVVVLGYNLVDTAALAGGLLLLVVGLALFLEGLLLGLMPLGERIGMHLPRKLPFILVCLFGLILGAGATLAEPAIAALRAAGARVTPWSAPLLFTLLNHRSGLLVAVIAAGVGLAVVLSVTRIYRGWSIKGPVAVLTLLALAVTVAGSLEPNVALVLALAWDAGAVTTGPVTVPLVVALGVGLSRVLERSSDTLAGFGSIAMASLTPVIAVLALAFVLLPTVPAPMSREEFFAPANETRALSVAGSAERLEALRNDTPPEAQASPLERNTIATTRAILPLAAFLVLVLLVVLRERLPEADLVALGVALAFVGMLFLSIGIETGLGRLGGQVGERLPASFREIADTERAIVIPDFDPTTVQQAVTRTGERSQFFYLEDQGRVLALPYDPDAFDSATGSYYHVPTRRPLLGSFGAAPGIALLLLFALVLGYGATLAEPALGALGITVEDLTAGTLRRGPLVQAVSVGVGIGMAVGLARILWNLPLPLLLAPPYAVALVLTLLSDESIVGVAWDSGGVTTGPVTVPLVLALGSGVGGALGWADGFGILAMASVYPVLAVLVTGLVQRARRRSALGTRRAA